MTSDYLSFLNRFLAHAFALLYLILNFYTLISINFDMTNKKQELTRETVMHIAKMARLNLTDREAKKYQKEIGEVLAAFKELKKVKTKAEPTFHPLPVKDVYRKDEVEASLKQEEALKNTKHKEGSFFKGPRVV